MRTCSSNSEPRSDVCARNKVFISLGTSPRIMVELCNALTTGNVNAGSMVVAAAAVVGGKFKYIIYVYHHEYIITSE